VKKIKDALARKQDHRLDQDSPQLGHVINRNHNRPNQYDFQVKEKRGTAWREQEEEDVSN